MSPGRRGGGGRGGESARLGAASRAASRARSCRVAALRRDPPAGPGGGCAPRRGPPARRSEGRRGVRPRDELGVAASPSPRPERPDPPDPEVHRRHRPPRPRCDRDLGGARGPRRRAALDRTGSVGDPSPSGVGPAARRDRTRVASARGAAPEARPKAAPPREGGDPTVPPPLHPPPIPLSGGGASGGQAPRGSGGSRVPGGVRLPHPQRPRPGRRPAPGDRQLPPREPRDPLPEEGGSR
jgi:hypothetical protein